VPAAAARRGEASTSATSRVGPSRGWRGFASPAEAQGSDGIVVDESAVQVRRVWLCGAAIRLPHGPHGELWPCR
jgi:hypothetical protein